MLKWIVLLVGAAAAAFGIKKLMSSNEPEIDEFAPIEPYTPNEATPAV
jgi:hypothetical protein